VRVGGAGEAAGTQAVRASAITPTPNHRRNMGTLGVHGIGVRIVLSPLAIASASLAQIDLDEDNPPILDFVFAEYSTQKVGRPNRLESSGEWVLENWVTGTQASHTFLF
jgi:hypothetical protein